MDAKRELCHLPLALARAEVVSSRGSGHLVDDADATVLMQVSLDINTYHYFVSYSGEGEIHKFCSPSTSCAMQGTQSTFPCSGNE